MRLIYLNYPICPKKVRNYSDKRLHHSENSLTHNSVNHFTKLLPNADEQKVQDKTTKARNSLRTPNILKQSN
ncbi:hypothetical protein Hanom_Chr00s000002g01599741 [Helianthus anomalus]